MRKKISGFCSSSYKLVSRWVTPIQNTTVIQRHSMRNTTTLFVALCNAAMAYAGYVAGENFAKNHGFDPIDAPDFVQQNFQFPFMILFLGLSQQFSIDLHLLLSRFFAKSTTSHGSSRSFRTETITGSSTSKMPAAYQSMSSSSSSSSSSAAAAGSSFDEKDPIYVAKPTKTDIFLQVSEFFLLRIQHYILASSLSLLPSVPELLTLLMPDNEWLLDDENKACLSKCLTALGVVTETSLARSGARLVMWQKEPNPADIEVIEAPATST